MGKDQLIHFISRNLASAGVAGCEDAIRKLPDVVGGRGVLHYLELGQIRNVDVHGDSARANVSSSALGTPQVVSLEKAEGGWKITAIPGLGTR
jgi:hypothetical protein